MVGAGAFCFAYYMNGFAGVAFVLGLALIIYGACHAIAYVIGFRKNHLPETLLVEGGFSFVFGFLIVADYVSEGNISSFFGIWMLATGLCRFSESLAVSKVNPKDWFAVLPLGIINTMVGFVMLVPGFLEGFDEVYIIAVAYLLQAFSVAIYALYMVKREPTKKAQEAKERAEAKKRAAEEKRKERDRLRSLSAAEREKERESARKQQVKEAEEKAASREARKDAFRAPGERTVEFTPQETNAIIEAAAEIEIDDSPISAEDIWGGKEETKQETQDPAIRPVFNKPVNIPVI